MIRFHEVSARYPGAAALALDGVSLEAPERTLTDDEVSEAMTRIVTALQHEHAAEQR